MFAWIIERSLSNRLLVVVAFVALLIVGLFTIRRITLDVFPEFAPPQVVIQTEAPSLPPQPAQMWMAARMPSEKTSGGSGSRRPSPVARRWALHATAQASSTSSGA